MNPPLTCYQRDFIRKRLTKLWALYKFPSRKTSTISNHDYYSTFYANHNQQSFFFLGVTFSSKVLQGNTCYEVYVHTSEKVYSRRVLPPSQVCLHLLWFRYQITCQQIETFFPSRAEMKIILVVFCDLLQLSHWRMVQWNFEQRKWTFLVALLSLCNWAFLKLLVTLDRWWYSPQSIKVTTMFVVDQKNKNNFSVKYGQPTSSAHSSQWLRIGRVTFYMLKHIKCAVYKIPQSSSFCKQTADQM